ncbi:hypothetical protein KC19_VG013900 [Ceratodon purpureus]|uniref:Uncharacterized protein n=1 Tax=Ceratodon purpureus TaxID=3225 RepID=A0A8T0HL82_CERPU|nr:hypothetical protein KC19_VG013900 [Ceratodon purpureus]
MQVSSVPLVPWADPSSPPIPYAMIPPLLIAIASSSFPPHHPSLPNLPSCTPTHMPATHITPKCTPSDQGPPCPSPTTIMPSSPPLPSPPRTSQQSPFIPSPLTATPELTLLPTNPPNP